jgi:hypothetical protein
VEGEVSEPGFRALILAGVGTVSLRPDGSVCVTDRNRDRYEIAPEVVRAIVALAAPLALTPCEEPTL